MRMAPSFFYIYYQFPPSYPLNTRIGFAFPNVEGHQTSPPHAFPLNFSSTFSLDRKFFPGPSQQSSENPVLSCRVAPCLFPTLLFIDLQVLPCPVHPLFSSIRIFVRHWPTRSTNPPPIQSLFFLSRGDGVRGNFPCYCSAIGL